MKKAEKHRAPWTKKDIDTLRKLGQTHTAGEIACILGRTYKAIEWQARKKGIRYVRKPQTGQGEQLCWRCYHATNRDNICPWVGRKPNGDIRWNPVPGWEAEEEIVNGEKTYWVKKCPLFREG